jgi:hypothetical protein
VGISAPQGPGTRETKVMNPEQFAASHVEPKRESVSAVERRSMNSQTSLIVSRRSSPAQPSLNRAPEREDSRVSAREARRARPIFDFLSPIHGARPRIICVESEI